MLLWSLRPRSPLLVGSMKSIQTVGYGRVLRQIKELLAKSGRNRAKCTLLSLLMEGATTLAARIGTSDRVFQKEGWRRPNAYKAYTHDIKKAR